MLTSDDPNPPRIGNLPIDDLISLYYVLWIILVQIELAVTFPSKLRRKKIELSR